MAKKIILNESTAKRILSEEILNEISSNKEEIASAIKDALKNDSGVKKDLEKKVKDIVASCVNALFKTLWIRHNFYEDEIKK